MTYSQSHGALVLSLSLFLLSACATDEARTSGGSTHASPTGSTMKAAPSANATVPNNPPHNPSPGATMKATPPAGAPAPNNTPHNPSSGSSMKAAPHPYDSLQACLARIPSGGTAGTRMLAEEGCHSNQALHESIAGSGTTKSGNRAAAGTVGDSLDDCIARIPKDSSAGQKMLAEETCKRDQGVRP